MLYLLYLGIFNALKYKHVQFICIGIYIKNRISSENKSKHVSQYFLLKISYILLAEYDKCVSIVCYVMTTVTSFGAEQITNTLQTVMSCGRCSILEQKRNYIRYRIAFTLCSWFVSSANLLYKNVIILFGFYYI